MAYSEDFRKKVLEIMALESLKVSETARRFKLSRRTVESWLVSIERKEHSNRYRKLSLEALQNDVEKYPDAYQYERAKRLGVGQNSIFHGLKRLGISYKKKPYTPKIGREKAYYLSTKD
jgi:transposase